MNTRPTHDLVRDPPAVPTLLWTGGWDSTFRLLQRLLIERQPVQTLYVVNPARQSTHAELDAMRRIKHGLFARYPEAETKLLDSRTVEFHEIERQDRYQTAHDRINAKQYLGTQYAWLARFCACRGIRNLELAIHQDDKAHRILAPFVNRSSTTEGYRIDDAFSETDEHRLFRFFVFPILALTKKEMQRIAYTEGFADLMKLTWFCHTPWRGRQPCGVCNPCVYTIEEGLGYRVPWRGKLKYHARALPFLNLGEPHA